MGNIYDLPWIRGFPWRGGGVGRGAGGGGGGGGGAGGGMRLVALHPGGPLSPVYPDPLASSCGMRPRARVQITRGVTHKYSGGWHMADGARARARARTQAFALVYVRLNIAEHSNKAPAGIFGADIRPERLARAKRARRAPPEDRSRSPPLPSPPFILDLVSTIVNKISTVNKRGAELRACGVGKR